MRRLLWTLFLLLEFVSYSFSQVATGNLPYNSYGGGPFDSVNLGNLNVHFTIPVLHKAGRGIPFNYDLNYDSSIYRPVGSNGAMSWQPVTNIGNIASYWGWQGLGPVFSPYVGYKVTYSSGMCGQYGNQPWSGYSFGYFVYYDASGTAHTLNAGGAYYNSPGGNYCPPNGPQPSGVETITAQDGSGYVINVSFGSGSATGNIQSKGGTTISAPWVTTPPTGSSPYASTDRNGNSISFNNGTYTDTLGQAVLQATGTAPNPINFSYIPPANESSGTRVSVTANFMNYTVKTNFNATDSSGHAIAEYSSSSPVGLVDNITLPDGTQYKFQYEATPSTPAVGACTPLNGTAGCVTGRILNITLPTLGSITYGYTGGVGGANGIINDGSTAGLTRQLSSPGGTWTYTRSPVSGNYWTTTVKSPTGDNTVLNFTEDSATGNAATYSFYETQRQVNQLINGVQTPLITTVTCWNGSSSNCTSTAVISPITEKAVTLQYPGGLQSKTDTSYNGLGAGSGLVSQINQYPYSAGTPTTLLRQTSIIYGSWNGSGCIPLGNNITDGPCDVTVYDTYNGTSYGVSKTRYTYDEYAVQSTSGTPQHGSITGSRGNVTTIQTALSWNPNNGVIGSSLTRHVKYYDTGNVYQSQDVNGQWTTYNYSTTSQGNSTQSCGNSFPTSVTLPISGLSSSTAYDCIGGVVTAVTDLNGNSATTSYTDAFFWRPASAVSPYTSTTHTTTSFTYSATTADAQMLFNGNNSVVEQLVTAGSFGQVLYSQQREGPTSSSWDSTQTVYDSFLRPYQTTMPCVTSSGSGCTGAATTTSTLDALGRVTQTTDGGTGWVKYTYTQNDVLQEFGPAPAGENTKQKQSEYDALGRLTSVCEKTTLTGYGVCSQQTSSPNGYLTTYAYGTTTINSLLYTTVTVTQNAQASSGKQTRVYTYDLSGRLVSEQNPENSTTAYTYDSDSSGTCSGTYTGDLIKLTDAKGNKACYQYDALHRLTQITYPSGPDSANTPAKHYVYDNATFNSTAMANPKGRRVEAYTGSSGSKTTDEFFSYSVRGELTDTWECTPHSGSNGCASTGNYYHVTAGFWENGTLKTLSSNISGLPTENYSVDSMGRISAVSASSGQNPVTSTSYNLSAFSYGVTFGSGDSDQFNLDPSTGRMTKYNFKVGTNADLGQMIWNPNGSLANLQILDSVPSTTDTQTCRHSHDDLSRIASVSCGGNSNLLNPGFESGNVNWSLGPGWTIVNNASNAQSGNWYLSGSSTAQTPAIATNGSGSRFFAVTPGSILQYGGWIKRVAGTGNIWWSCEVVDAHYNLLAWCSTAGLSDGSGGAGWNYYENSLTVPANGAYVQFYAEIHGGGDTDTSLTTGYFDTAFFTVSGSLWNQAFTYDAFGNISKSSNGPGSSFQATYSSSTNWITALSGVTPTYDNNGQLTYDGSNNYGWDVEGKMITLGSMALTYDALGRMVEKNAGSAYTEIVYGVSGEKFATMNGQTLQKAFVPLPAAVAVYKPSGLAYYRHSDHLGSSRLATTPSKSMYSSASYAPFGEPYAQAGTQDLSFTGQDQDTLAGAQGLYDFLARKQSPVQGRWLSPDPAGLGAVNPANPQSWNRYAYVMNNPMALIDPLGLDCVYVYDDGTTGIVSGDCFSESDNGYYFDGTVSSASYYVDFNGNESLSVIFGGLLQIITDASGIATSGMSPAIIGNAGIPGFTPPTTGIAPSPPISGGGGAANNASPDPTLDNRANALAQALRKTGVQTLNSPCTIGGFYVASATLGAGGAAVANSEEIVAVASENYPTWLNKFFSWLTQKASNPGPVGATGAAIRTAYGAGKQFCSSF